MVVDGLRGDVDGWDTALQTRSSRVRSQMYISGLAMALSSAQPLREMSTRKIFWGVRAAGE